MIEKMLVSTIIPFYNTSPEYMREAIDSVIGQTYHDWEILLVNDGSNEASVDVAQQYTEKYPGKVRLLHHKNRQNRGASTSRQLGIIHSKGEYIALLDADDIWHPNKLEQQVALMQEHPQAAMLYGNTLYWYSWSGKVEDRKRDYMPKLGVLTNILIPPPRLLSLYLLGKAAVPCTCSLLIRREVLERIGGFEDSFPGMYDDQVLYAKICLEASVFASDQCWDKYRQHSGSLSSDSIGRGQHRAARITYLRWLETYLNQKKIFDIEVWQALKRELWLHQESAFRLGPAPNLVRRLKKWFLKFEEYLLPSSIRRWLWTGESGH